MEDGKVFNHKQQKLLRQQLRSNMPLPEKILWAKIRNQQLGIKFRRQHGIGRYIVDFYCAECGLVIELDGDSHYKVGAQEYDKIRDEFMRCLGLRVLRFTNRQIVKDIDAAMRKIVEELNVAN